MKRLLAASALAVVALAPAAFAIDPPALGGQCDGIVDVGCRPPCHDELDCGLIPPCVLYVAGVCVIGG